MQTHGVARGALLLFAVCALILPGIAHGAPGDERALAERYAPVVRLVQQDEECGPGEPYEPMDVDALFGSRQSR